MEARIYPPAAYVNDAGGELGRGVFAAVPLEQGDLVEVAPVILLGASWAALPSELQQRVFNWRRLGGATDACAFALGYGGMYNSDDSPNLRYEADIEQMALRFIAVRDIARDEELTVNYGATGGGTKSDSDWWFEKTGVKKITRPGTQPGTQPATGTANPGDTQHLRAAGPCTSGDAIERARGASIPGEMR